MVKLTNWEIMVIHRYIANLWISPQIGFVSFTILNVRL